MFCFLDKTSNYKIIDEYITLVNKKMSPLISRINKLEESYNDIKKEDLLRISKNFKYSGEFEKMNIRLNNIDAMIGDIIHDWKFKFPSIYDFLISKIPNKYKNHLIIEYFNAFYVFLLKIEEIDGIELINKHYDLNISIESFEEDVLIYQTSKFEVNLSKKIAKIKKIYKKIINKLKNVRRK